MNKKSSNLLSVRMANPPYWMGNKTGNPLWDKPRWNSNKWIWSCNICLAEGVSPKPWDVSFTNGRCHLARMHYDLFQLVWDAKYRPHARARHAAVLAGLKEADDADAPWMRHLWQKISDERSDLMFAAGVMEIDV